MCVVFFRKTMKTDKVTAILRHKTTFFKQSKSNLRYACFVAFHFAAVYMAIQHGMQIRHIHFTFHQALLINVNSFKDIIFKMHDGRGNKLSI